MNEKPKSAHAYSADITRDCETVLVILLRAFAGFKGNLRLIGGLVPRYLTPETLADHFSARLVEGRQCKALNAALHALSRRFCNDADVEGYRKEGPAAFVNFHGFDREHADTRIRALRQVSGLVSHVLARISAKTGQSYLHEAAT
ncbi:hypothetical protein [Achromobacter kerstersii]